MFLQIRAIRLELFEFFDFSAAAFLFTNHFLSKALAIFYRTHSAKDGALFGSIATGKFS